ncbi:hypothetical protein LGH82_25030 [Mesorhizobium sp. PAMC28654]|uniref:hypothetical protein n=1 Tax=Mesorhizobium sp. PAMC28654 TaxID=2880934 RepID=UPI001D0BCB0E|nr:hypothetical protein [Mesorhizobium sp. PAMC28654]UDL88372.1 hypothetical protein LGH82_25030 [Mesorhizobium sp. PAMC28654]
MSSVTLIREEETATAAAITTLTASGCRRHAVMRITIRAQRGVVVGGGGTSGVTAIATFAPIADEKDGAIAAMPAIAAIGGDVEGVNPVR